MTKKTNAQRQADFRNRHFKAEDGQLSRLNIAISVHAKSALERLSCRYGVTQRDMLERLIKRAEEIATKQLSAELLKAYYEKRPLMDVTQ